MNADIRCLATRGDGPVDAAFVFDAADMGPARSATIILTDGPEQRAESLLAAGAARVLMGEAALLDSTLIGRLAARHGSHRVGIYVPARRLESQWSFDTSSNADFRVVTPSVCEPAWEVLRADGSGSGALVGWWIAEMFRRGASVALVRADIRDDADLNICAGLVEDLDDRLWLGPLTDTEPKLDEWTAYGRLRQIVLPAGLFSRLVQPAEAPAGELAELA